MAQTEQHKSIKCKCGCDIQFFGEIPNNYVCGRCGNKIKGIKENKKLNKNFEKIE